MKVREVVFLIEQEGWIYSYSRSSHHYYINSMRPELGKLTVPGHPNDELAKGTLNSILKQAGLK